MEYKTLRQLDLKKGDIIEDAQGKRGVVWFVEKDSIKATYPDGNCRHYDMDIAQYKKIIAEPKLEVGQYWHHLEAGTEILIQQGLTGLFTKSGRWVDADGELGNERDFEGDKIAYSLVKSILSRGYVLGRHPDKIEAAPKWLTLAECKPCVGDVLEFKYSFDGVNINIQCITVSKLEIDGIEFTDGHYFYFSNNKRFRVKSRAAQPEEWQPKEGELVWCVFKNNRKPKKGRVIKCPDTDALGVYYCNDGGYLMDYPISSCEPYDNQDAKIDFSIAGQWVRNDSNVVLITTGETDELIFYGFNPRNGAECKFRSDLFNWKLLTPEQMKPILELIANI